MFTLGFAGALTILPDRPVAADVDQDGDLDLIVAASIATGGEVAVLLNNGAGSFAAATYPAEAAGVAAGVVALNGSDPDLLVVEADRDLLSFLGTPGIGFGAVGTEAVSGVGPSPVITAAA